jgi:O-antigen ligase
MSAFLSAAPAAIPPPRALSSRIAIAALAVVVLTLPFAHSVAIRNIALAVAVLCTIASWRSLHMPRPPLLWFFIGAAVLGGLSLVWAGDPAYSRRELKTELLYPVVVFLLTFALVADRRALAWLGLAAAAAAVLSAGGAFAAWSDYTWAQRAFLYNGLGFYSTWLIAVYPFALATCFASALDARWRYFALAVALLILAAGVATFNRSFPLVAALQTGLLVAYELLRARAGGQYRQLILAMVVATVLVGSVFAVHKERHSIGRTNAADIGVSLQRDVRWGLWTYSAQHILEHPLRGAGFGRGTMRRDLNEKFKDTPEGGSLWHAHNVVLNWGLQMGLPGAALLLALFGGACWKLARAHRIAEESLRPYLFAAIVMVIGLFLKNQTDDFFVRQTALTFWIALGALLGVSARVRKSGSTPA